MTESREWLTLDVGCGLAKLGDINIDINKQVRPTIVAHACALPFPNQTFSLVTAFNVLEHIVDYKGALRELRRIGNGNVKIRLDNTLSPVNWLHPEHEWITIGSCFYRRPWVLRILTRPLKLLANTLLGKLLSWTVSWTLRWTVKGLN